MERLKIESPVQGQKVLDCLYRDIERRVSSSPLGLCPVDMTLSFLRMCHSQSCGKCVPCRVGLGQIEKLLESILDGTADMDTIQLIEHTATMIRDTADCAIGYESAEMVLRGIKGFRDDFIQHIESGTFDGSLAMSVRIITSAARPNLS